MGSASIIGFGNILGGDFGAGCYIIDALCQEGLGEDIELAYLGEDARYSAAFVVGKRFTVVVQAVVLGRTPGTVCCWDLAGFHQNLSWFSELADCPWQLARSLQWARWLGCYPKDVLFVWIEPRLTDGLGISEEVRRAVRKVIRLIKAALFERGLLPGKASTLPRIHYMHLLGVSF
jgi:hydrogenase maturation protease